MKTESPTLLSKKQAIPSDWLSDVHSYLTEDEIILGHLEIDLDSRLYFVPGIVIITNFRLFSKTRNDASWEEWFYRQDLALVHQDHAGVGSLELHDKTTRLASWRYTLGHNPDALRLIDQFERQCNALVSGHLAHTQEETVCPSCKAILLPDQEECPICTTEVHAPSTASLFRLWRFAKPYKGQLLIGFLLTLASTAATLV